MINDVVGSVSLPLPVVPAVHCSYCSPSPFSQLRCHVIVNAGREFVVRHEIGRKSKEDLMNRHSLYVIKHTSPEKGDFGR